MPIMILTEDRREYKDTSGREKMGKVKYQRKNNMDVEEMDYAKPTKKQGRVTTP